MTTGYTMATTELKNTKTDCKEPAAGKAGLSVVVPAHNEEGNIIELVERFDTLKRNHSYIDLEVIFVDDGSTDGTYEKMNHCRESHDFISIIRFRRNQGLTSALNAGFHAARHEFLAFYPADLQYLPEDLAVLVAPLIERDDVDIVCGKRIGEYKKWFISKIYSHFSRLFFNVKVTDQNSVKVFRRALIDELCLRSSMHRYIVAVASYKGYRIVEVPINLYPRKWGRSKFFDPLRVVSGILDLISIKFELTFLDRPMVFFGGMGIMLIFIGLLVGASYYPLRVLGLITSPAKFTFFITSWGAILSGIMLFCFGFISDFILRVVGNNTNTASVLSYQPCRAQQNEKDTSACE